MNEGIYVNKDADMFKDTPKPEEKVEDVNLEVKPVEPEEHELPNPDDEEIFVKKPVQLKIEKKVKKKKTIITTTNRSFKKNERKE